MSNNLSEKDRKGPIAWMTGNPVAANIIMLALILGGGFSMMNVKQEVFPEFEVDRVVITVPYPGASPEEVSKSIVHAVEDAIENVDNVEETRSIASEGMSTTIVKIINGADLQKLSQDIKNAVDRITSFPVDAEEPTVSTPTTKRQAMSLTLFGEASEGVLRQAAEQVRMDLLASPAVSVVELSGVRPLEVQIEISQDNLRRYGLTIDEVAMKLRNSSVDLPSGGMKTKAGEILVRVNDRRDYGAEFAKIPIISTSDGTELLLSDIATVRDGFSEVDTFSSYNEKPAVTIQVTRVGDQTPISVSDGVHDVLPKISAKLPEGLELRILQDKSEIYRQRIDLLLRNMGLGLLLVIVLLSLFLELRLAFWVTMGIPISFLGAFVILPFFGVSLNMISLFAFIISLGIVVDDAIVVGENVYKLRQKGVPFFKAAVLGTKEVGMPVVFSVLTNIVAFLPMAFVSGTMGKVMYCIPAVVVSVFIISLFESLLILPAHLGHGGEVPETGVFGWIHHKQQRFSKWFKHLVADYYGPFLDWTLRWRYFTISLGLMVLICTVAYAVTRPRVELFPKVEADFAVARAELPYGTDVANTKKLQTLLLKKANEVVAANGGTKLLEGLSASIKNNQLTIKAYLTDPGIRPISTNEFTNKWRKAVGELSGIKSLVFRSDEGGPGNGAALTVELSHADPKVLEKAASELAEGLRTYEKTSEVDAGFGSGKQQLNVKLKPYGKSLKLTSSYLSRQLRGSFYGAEVLRQQRGRNEVKVMVRLPEKDRRSEYAFEDMIVRTPAGKEVMLREVADVTRGRAYTEINLSEGQRVLTVSANVTPQSDATGIIKKIEENELPELMKKYPGLTYGYEGKQADMKDSISGLMYGLLVAVMMIYVLLAIPFRSYLQPLIIMVSIPFGIVGAVLGHLVMGYSLSIISMFGIVALSGVVVNDSLVLIDFANKEHADGKNRHDSIHSSGVTRFRPIMLTTLSTFFGLAPMIFETSRQARFLIPMALSLGFGILFATFITLVLVPSLYMILEDFRNAMTRVFYCSSK